MEQPYESAQGPQDAFTAPVEEGHPTSVIDDMMDFSNEGSEAFGLPAEAVHQQEPLPDQNAQRFQQPAPAQQMQPEQGGVSNEEVRSAYWQSQHDKMKNELDTMKANQVVQEEAAPKEETPIFPDPPLPPERPYNFNNDDVMSDPNSDSAQYAMKHQAFQQDMMNYNVMKTEWTAQQMEVERDKFRQDIADREAAEVASKEKAAQHRAITSTLMREFGADQVTAQQFIREMSNPNPSLQELWGLYQMKHGRGPGPAQQHTQLPPNMQQMQHAQRSAPPMGTMPGVANQAQGRSESDLIMDDIILRQNAGGAF
jgi:hypothetical protein